MTTESAYAGDDPHRLLSSIGELAHGVRRAQRAAWFPLLAFAAVTFAAIPVERYGHYAATCRAVPAAGPAARACVAYSTAAFVYWPIALVLAYAAIAGFYIRRSRARGVGTRVRPYVIAGIAVAIAVTCAALWAAHNPFVGEQDILGLHVAAAPPGLFSRLASPACAIGLALLVLAWAERSRALLVFTLGYLAIVLVPVTFGWAMTRPWFYLPHLVIDGTVLLLGGVGFALARRPARRPAR
jgi:hypothetical protein